MTIAVTAASGRLGAEIISSLSQLGTHSVVGLARTPANAQHLGIEIRPGDYGSPADLEQSLRGIETVLLVSAMDEPAKRVGLHRNVIDAAKRAGVGKIVYTSVQGAEAGTGFSPVVQSNRQTEKDVAASGLDWVIGRNGIYIEPDVEYIETYKSAGCIANCAGDSKCGYTTRPELADAYARMLTEVKHSGQIYNLHGEALTQAQLAEHLNRAFGTELVFADMTVDQYREERVAELGDFLGSVIAGIYEGIRSGAADSPSQFLAAAGREHQSWSDYFASVRAGR